MHPPVATPASEADNRPRPLGEGAMTQFPLPGGCHCGAVRYQVRGPALSVQHCHCSRCRKMYGTLYASGAVIERSKVMITGEENLTTYRRSPSFADRFCKTCGCWLFSYEEG